MCDSHRERPAPPSAASLLTVGKPGLQHRPVTQGRVLAALQGAGSSPGPWATWRPRFALELAAGWWSSVPWDHPLKRDTCCPESAVATRPEPLLLLAWPEGWLAGWGLAKGEPGPRQRLCLQLAGGGGPASLRLHSVTWGVQHPFSRPSYRRGSPGLRGRPPPGELVLIYSSVPSFIEKPLTGHLPGSVPVSQLVSGRTRTRRFPTAELALASCQGPTSPSVQGTAPSVSPGPGGLHPGCDLPRPLALSLPRRARTPSRPWPRRRTCWSVRSGSCGARPRRPPTTLRPCAPSWTSRTTG